MTNQTNRENLPLQTNKNPRPPPCGSLGYLWSSSEFLSAHVIYFAMSDPNSRAEWCALSIWENAESCMIAFPSWYSLPFMLLDMRNMCRFFPHPHLEISSFTCISIPHSLWMLMLFLKMWRDVSWAIIRRLPVQSQQGRDHRLMNWEVSPLAFSKSTLSWLVNFSGESEAN